MAYLLIDGYNLIGTAHKDLEKARNDIIEKLSQYSKLKGHEITLVFDGWKSGQLNEARDRVGNVTVIFSRVGEKADSVIKRILSGGPREWIVISSDREISDFAENRGFASIDSDEFEGRLYSDLHFTQKTEVKETFKDDEDIEPTPVHRKGSSRRPSKKQKKKLRALEKL